MMNRILGQHPDVSALNELHYIGSIWDLEAPLETLSAEKSVELAALLLMRVRNGVWGGPPGEAEIADAREVIGAESSWTHKEIYQRVLSRESGSAARLVTDQTPRNVLFASDILRTFPEARVIHMIRDPRAVLASQRNRWKKRWRGADSMPIWNVLRVLVNYHPYTLTRLWKKSARVAAELRSNDRYRVVKFERLASDPESEVRAISQFLEIEFNPAMLLVPQVGSSIKVHDETKLGVTSDVVDSWRRVLPKGDIVVCERVAAKLMKDNGYEPVGKPAWGWRVLGPLFRFPFHVLGAVALNSSVIGVHVRSMVRSKW
jgi:hypothetical protein